MTKRLLLVDHNALLHRCRSALLRTGRRYTTADGTPTTGVFSYLNCLLSIIKTQSPTHVVVCFDAGGNSRKEESDTYKANRKPLDPDFLIENRILKEEALYAMGIEAIGLRGYEADDILYTMSHVAQFGTEKFDEVIIATVDQDLLQCVTERCAVLLWNSVKKQQMMWVPEVMEKWGCEPADIRLVKALSGDSSDNIKGVKGIGPKTAVKLLRDASWDLSEVIKTDKIAPHAVQVMENLELVTLKNMTDVLEPINWEDHRLGLGMESDLLDLVTKYEMNSLIKRMSSILDTLRVKSLSD